MQNGADSDPGANKRMTFPVLDSGPKLLEARKFLFKNIEALF
jgi:hypothetical protein